MRKLSNSVRVDEASDFVLQVDNYVANKDLSEYPDYKLIVDKLLAKGKQLTTAINRELIRSQMKAADEVRMLSMKKIDALLTSTALQANSSSAAAVKLKSVFDRYYSHLLSASYAKKNSQIASLIEDFETDEMQELLRSVLFLGTVFDELKVGQADCMEKRSDYTVAIGERKTMDNASTVKRQVLQIINNELLPYQQSMQEHKSGEFEVISRTVQSIVDHANQTVSIRQNRAVVAVVQELKEAV